MTRIINLPGDANLVCFSKVTGMHLHDNCLINGRFDVTRARPLSRLQYRNYTVGNEAFTLKRPGE